ncbi:MAG: acyltransferase [Candidatus Cloacimonetes bacterium]|nr:acyltransferase [Candidatus Cloacimonadota bacterium]
MKFEIPEKNVRIVASEINIDVNSSFGKNINVELKGTFGLGKNSHIGGNSQILGNNVSFGSHLFTGSGLNIGGGGRQHPNANLTVGDRCSIYCNLINVCEEVSIGNDVGLSPEVTIITHGFWLSVLEGYPMLFAGVTIGNGVIVGYRSTILMGVSIADYCVLGAHSVVTKSLIKKGIYAGSPAKFIREIVPLSYEQRVLKMEEMITEYKKIAAYHSINPVIQLDYPRIQVNDFFVNAETLEFSGTEDRETDDFRDYIRKWGIRIHTDRPFVNCYSLD